MAIISQRIQADIELRLKSGARGRGGGKRSKETGRGGNRGKREKKKEEGSEVDIAK